MVAALVVALRSLALICEQLAVFKRTVTRPQLRHRDLRRGVPPASRWHGYRRGSVGSVQSLAEPVCGEADWINQARLPAPRGGTRRTAFAPSPGQLSCVL